jgi:MFS family permease
VGVALVAEVMSDRARPFALGWLQALSAVGNMLAALVSMALGKFEESGAIGSAWRLMFLVGLAPAALAIPIFLRLKEPERWKAAATENQVAGPGKAKLGSLLELFGDPVLRRNTLVGMILAFAGVVGLWGIGFFSFDLVDLVFRKHFEGLGISAREISGKLTFWKGITSLLQNAGAFFGIYAFARITHYIGRKPAFGISFVLAATATVATFWFLDTFWQIFVLIPIMGILSARALRRLCDLLPRALPDPAAQHRHLVLLQRGPAGRGRRTFRQGLTFKQGIRRFSRAHALCGNLDVRGLPGRAFRFTLRTRDARPAASGMNGFFVIAHPARSGPVSLSACG